MEFRLYPMKPFRFTLQALRIVRQRQEQVALEHYAAALQARQEAAQRLRRVERQRDMAWSHRQNLPHAKIPAASFAHNHAYCREIESICRDCETALGVAQDVLHQKWLRLIETRKQREAVDKYYDRQRRDFERLSAREEQKLLDELGNRPGLLGEVRQELAGGMEG